MYKRRFIRPSRCYREKNAKTVIRVGNHFTWWQSALSNPFCFSCRQFVNNKFSSLFVSAPSTKCYISHCQRIKYIIRKVFLLLYWCIVYYTSTYNTRQRCYMYHQLENTSTVHPSRQFHWLCFQILIVVMSPGYTYIIPKYRYHNNAGINLTQRVGFVLYRCVKHATRNTAYLLYYLVTLHYLHREA